MIANEKIIVASLFWYCKKKLLLNKLITLRAIMWRWNFCWKRKRMVADNKISDE